MQIKLYILCLFICLGILNCSPKSSSAGQGSSVGSGAAGLASANGSSTSTSTAVGSDVVLDQASLNAMTLDQVQAIYQTRITQLQSAKQNFSIDDQIANALCQRYQQLMAGCTTSNTLIPIGSSELNCGGGTSTFTSISTASPFSVIITDSSGNPLKTVPGQYILVANNLYESTPFGAGQTNISFTFAAGAVAGATVTPPQLKQLFSLELRNSADTANNSATYMPTITSGKASPLPSISSIFIQLFYNGVKLTDGPLNSETAPYTKFRYFVNLKTIIADSASANCVVQTAEIKNIQNQITTSIQSQDAQNAAAGVFAQQSTAQPTKAQMVAAILSAQTQIANIEPLNDNDNNRILNLIGELQASQAVGCHLAEPITDLQVTILGTVNDPKDIGFFNTCPKFTPAGAGTNLSINLGTGVVVNVAGASVVGLATGWMGAVSSQALVANINYLNISKLGISISEEVVCKSGILGTSSSCAQDCSELNTFTISGVKIAVQTPSTSPNFVTIYDNENLNVIFGSSYYSSSAVTSWNDPNLKNDPNWVKFMQDTSCSATN